jgi:hypothetical protein
MHEAHVTVGSAAELCRIESICAEVPHLAPVHPKKVLLNTQGRSMLRPYKDNTIK